MAVPSFGHYVLNRQQAKPLRFTLLPTLGESVKSSCLANSDIEYFLKKHVNNNPDVALRQYQSVLVLYDQASRAISTG